MLEKKYRNILLVSISLVLLSGLFWFKTEMDTLEATKKHRNYIKSQLHSRIRSQYKEVVSTELDSHCGRVIYSFKVSDGQHFTTLYFDVDTGQHLNKQWMNNCLFIPNEAPLRTD